MNEQSFTPDQPVEFLFRRANQAFWIDATIVCPDPLEIRYANPPSKVSSGGTICYRKLKTAADRERIRPLPADALPKRAIDQEQRLRDAVWNGDVNGLTTREIAARFGLERQRTHHVLYYILAGKSADNRFSKPAGSNYHDWRVYISEGRIFTREPVSGPPHNEYRWFIVEGQ